MDRLLSSIEARIKRAWIAAIAHLRELNSVERIALRMYTQDPTVVLDGFDDAIASLAAAEHNAYTTAGQTAARWLERQFAKRGPATIAKKLLSFDPADATAVRWAERNRLDLIREINAEQRILIRDALMDGAITGVNPRVTAAAIRDSIGLTASQESAVRSYRSSLERGQYAAALQRELSSGVSDRVISAARAASRELTQAQIDVAVSRYRENFVRMRAETIARTEALRVAHQGNEELYRQAIGRGDLRADTLERTWHHSPGAKNKRNERAFHRSMEGQVRGFGEPFISGMGNELRFPGDPEAPAEETVNCRCVIATRMTGAGAGRPGLGGAAAAEEELAVVDETALEEEAAIAEEEIAAAEQAALEEEFADVVEPDMGIGDEDPWLPPPSPPAPTWREQQLQQQMQQAQARLEAAQAAHEQSTLELEAAQREFRIGIGALGDEAEIAADTEAMPLRPPLDYEPAPPVEILGDPYRTSSGPARDIALPSDKPAPLGYESVEYNSELYYRHQITGRSYTPMQYAERVRDADVGWTIDLTGPNEQIPGYQAREVLSRNMISQGRAPELRYRSEKTGHTYTAAQVASGEAAELDSFLIEEATKPKPRRGLLSRLRSLLSGED